MLESQLQAERQSHTEELEALRAELQVLKEEREQQQEHLLSDTLQLPHDGRVNAALQSEISRLTRHNLVSAQAAELCLERSCYSSDVRSCFVEELNENVGISSECRI